MNPLPELLLSIPASPAGAALRQACQCLPGPARRAVLRGFLALACAIAADTAFASHEIAIWKAGKTPALALSTLDGTPWTLTAQKGRVVVVNFWATWCEPCKAEMPSLQALAERFGPDKLVVVGVNYQENEMRIQRYLATSPVKFPILLDRDGAAAKGWTRRIFPTTVLVGPDGRPRTVVTGEFDWAGAEAEKLVRDLLPR